jgi:predicted dehydrogenase
MYKVLIIGAGQLGSRHLQGVLQSKNGLHVTVVDPSLESLGVAEARANEMKKGVDETVVNYSQKIPKGDVIDVCIIATTANIRYRVTKELLSNNSVKHIVFEKVLFQKAEEYKRVKELLNLGGSQGWINCPRRLYPTYKHLKELLSQEASVDMEVSGSGWGLACNSVHFLDLYAYLTNQTEYKITENNLDRKVISSKRKGFYEVTGEFQAESKKGNINLRCTDSELIELQVLLSSPKYKILVDETGGYYTYEVNGNLEKVIHTPLYQSQLSGNNVDELIDSGVSSLTPYKDSCDIHTPFITLIKKHLEISLGQHLDACPIT